MSTDTVCVSRQSTAGRIAKVCGTSAVFSRRKMEEPRQKRKKKKGKEGRKQVDGDVLATRDRLSLSLVMVQGGLHLLYSLYVYVSGFALPPVLFCLLSRLRSSPSVHFPHSFSLDPLFFFYFFTSIFVMDELSLRWPLLTISFLHTCCPHTHTHSHKTQTVHSFLAMRANPPPPSV